MKNIVIRKIDGNDALAFYKFRYQLALETELTMNKYPEEIESDLEVLKEKLTPDSEVIIRHQAAFAFLDDEIIAYASLGPIEDTVKAGHRAYVGIGVLEKYQGKGLGNMMMETLFKLAKENGFTQLELEVVEGNEKAYNLYKKYGFIEYALRPNSEILKNGRHMSNILMYKNIENEN